ncbi:MAG: bifunctional class I SAM-dependent methyltransferase/glycosyltransferase family 2 protein [Vicinamibacteria bacterium]
MVSEQQELSPLAKGARDEVRAFYESQHEPLAKARENRSYYYEYLARILRARIAPGQRVLDIGCGAGDLLAACSPSFGVGIDLSGKAVAAARVRHPHLHFFEGDGGEAATLAQARGPFDVILIVNVLTFMGDVRRLFDALHLVSHAKTRVIIYSYSRLWQPVLRFAEILGMKQAQPADAWIPQEEVRAMLHLGDWDVVREDRQIIFPIYVPLVSEVLNRWIGHLPLADELSLMFGIVARPRLARHRGSMKSEPSVSVVIPCRNEEGHIAPMVARLPELPPNSEYIFVEGGSKDGTEAAIRLAIETNPGKPLRFLKQTGKGKGDAVRLGFEAARGEVLAILDSDMGVAPEDLPSFVNALARGHAEFVNGSRLVYPMAGKAMRFLNLLANKFFAALFSWILGQSCRDTLCGTKVLYRSDYERIAANRAYFGDFDPFGDFDLLFGASRLSLHIVDLAVRYHEREYGETNINRFSHGFLLLRMSAFASRKLKFL